MSRLLARLFGSDWSTAPAVLRRLVAVVLVQALVVLLLSAAEAAAHGDSVVPVLAVEAVLTALEVWLCALLLRRSRLVWLLLTSLGAVVLGLMPWATPLDVWEVLNYLATAVVVVALLTPGVLREVWRRGSREQQLYVRTEPGGR